MAKRVSASRKNDQVANKRRTGRSKESLINKINFPVVGVGASAGGLEALQEFFKFMPTDVGAAFVIVQHLSPDYKSLMDELLARHTKMTIRKVEDGMRIEKNHIYLIPPKMNMTIMSGVLLLTEQAPGRNLNLPIDIFLRSLAKDQEKNAIGIILSGTGSDGALGIRAIKEAGGISMVQDDQSAKFAGMPRSSISTGMVDFILPPNRLAEELANYIKHPLIQKNLQIEKEISKNETQLSKIIEIIRSTKGVDFSQYKDNTIIRRLEKRISLNGIDRLENYVKFITENPREVDILFNDLLIGVTRFFRDEQAMKKLAETVIPAIFSSADYSGSIRIWVAGCSTGEEAYSIAILVREYMTLHKINREVKIFATDISVSALEYAANGLYPLSIATDVSPERILRFFNRKNNEYQVNESIRSMVVFARHNLLQDPPFSKLDLISCRNVLIYLSNEVQAKIISMFYLALLEGSYLFLGSSESLGKLSDGFSIIDSKYKIFKYKSGFRAKVAEVYGFNSGYRALTEARTRLQDTDLPKSNVHSLDEVLREAVNDFVPPSVMVDENINILHVIHKVPPYVILPQGAMSTNLLKMLPKNLSVLVSSMFRRMLSKPQPKVSMENIAHPLDDHKLLTISVRKLLNRRSGDVAYLISFEENDVVEKKKTTGKIVSGKQVQEYIERIEELERDLQFKSESLQATVEELETSNEELQSSNEELIASNEELQSTNEELQSVNEELYTVNSEHLKKIEELTELNADIDNLMKNTHIGTLFLDRNLTIRKINDLGSRLTNILPGDLGRPVHHFSFEHLYKGFIIDLFEVVDTIQPIDKEVRDNAGNWYLMRIRPYRTIENAIDGIIVTFIEINTLKNAQDEVDSLTQRLDAALKMGEMSWWTWNYKTNEVRAGDAKFTMLGYTPGELRPGFEGWTVLIHPDDYDKAMNAMRDHLSGIKPFYEVIYRIKAKNGNYLWYKDKGGVVERDENGKPVLLSGIVMNVSEEMFALQDKNEAIDERIISDDRFRLLFESMPQGVVYQAADGSILDANPAAQEILGRSRPVLVDRTSKDDDWKAIYQNGKPFPGEKHPSMVALRTGKTVSNVTMGVYHPKRKQHVWINITAIPLFKPGSKKAFQVYTLFSEI